MSFENHCNSPSFTHTQCELSAAIGFFSFAACCVMMIYTLDRLFCFPSRNLSKIRHLRNKVGTFTSNSQRILAITPMLQGKNNKKFDKLELPEDTPTSVASIASPGAPVIASTEPELSTNTPKTFTSTAARANTADDAGKPSNGLGVIPSDDNIPASIGVNAIISSISSIDTSPTSLARGFDETPIISSVTPTVSHAKLIQKLGRIEKEAESILKLKKTMIASIVLALVFAWLATAYFTVLIVSDVSCASGQFFVLFYGLHRIGLYNFFIESLQKTFDRLKFVLSKSFVVSYKIFVVVSLVVAVGLYVHASFAGAGGYNSECLKSDLKDVIVYFLVVDVVCRASVILIFSSKLCHLYAKNEAAVTPMPTPFDVETARQRRELSLNSLDFADFDVQFAGAKQTQLTTRLDLSRALSESKRDMKKYVVLLGVSLVLSVGLYFVMMELVLIAVCLDLVVNNVCLLSWFHCLNDCHSVCSKFCLWCEKKVWHV